MTKHCIEIDTASIEVTYKCDFCGDTISDTVDNLIFNGVPLCNCEEFQVEMTEVCAFIICKT